MREGEELEDRVREAEAETDRRLDEVNEQMDTIIERYNGKG